MLAIYARRGNHSLIFDPLDSDIIFHLVHRLAKQPHFPRSRFHSAEACVLESALIDVLFVFNYSPIVYINSLLAMQVLLHWSLINDLILRRLNARNAQMREGAQERPVDGPKFLRFAPHTSRSGPKQLNRDSTL